MNTRRKTAITKAGGVANERIPPFGEQAAIVNQEDVNEEVPPKEPEEPQVLQMPEIPPMTQGPQDPYVEGILIIWI